jgi:hypothetical protein
MRFAAELLAIKASACCRVSFFSYTLYRDGSKLSRSADTDEPDVYRLHQNFRITKVSLNDQHDSRSRQSHAPPGSKEPRTRPAQEEVIATPD